MAAINGKTVPFSGYEAGDFYTEEPTNGAYQCMGFGYLIYKKIWGSYTYGSKITSKTTSTPELAKTALDSLKIGAMINCDRLSNQGNHSMILIGRSSTGVTVYDANWSGYENGERNKIGTRTWTWVDFMSKFAQIKSGYNPS